MTLWMLYAILFGALAIGAGLALERGARAIALPTRFAWMTILVIAMSAPFALSSLSARVPTGGSVEFVQRPGAVAGAVTPVSAQPSWLDRFAGRAVALDRPLTILWFALSALFLGRFVIAMLALRRQRHRWTARDIVGTECFVTPDIGPAVIAMPEARIVVPEWVLSLDADSLATVIRHEREHKIARDGWLIVTGSVAAALMPWNPSVWFIRRRLRLAVEMDCDARVLAKEPRVDRYGSLLLAIAQRPRFVADLAATLTESTSDLERRIDAMTARPPKHPRARALLFAAAGVVAIAVACSMPAPDMVAPRPADPMAQRVAAADVYFDFQVEKPASANPSNMPPRYPNQLRAANIEGQVVGKFVVDTNGHADMRTFEILKSDHEQFTTAVREALVNMRFYPARVGGRPVKQLVQMPFSFSLVRGAARQSSGVGQAVVSQRPKVVVETRSIPVAGVGQPVESKSSKVMFEFQVEQPASANPSNMPPQYPVQLRTANIEGAVLAKFVVDTSGRADLRSFEVIKSDHEQFTTAVREALAEMRFYPARVGGRPVKQLIQMPFTFSLSK